MDRRDIHTLTQRIDSEFYVDRYGQIVRYQPHWEPVTVTLSDGCTFTDKDDDTDPWHYTSLHSEILRQHVGDEAYYVGGYDRRGTDYLERELGWIAVGKCGHESEPWAYLRPTQDQISTLFDLGFVHMIEEVFYGTTTRFWYFRR